MKKEDKDIEIHFENGHVPRRQNETAIFQIPPRAICAERKKNQGR